MQDKFTAIGEILKSAREDKKISQQTMAAFLRIDQSVYSRIENDPSKMKVERLFKVCKFLQLEIDIIIKPLF